MRTMSLPKTICFTVLAALSLSGAVLIVISWIRGQSQFVWYSVRPSHGPGGVSYESPHAVALVCALMLPMFWVWWTIRFLQRRRSLRASTWQACSVCGYDLRATPARCPECGTVPRAAPAAA
jgi:hypothetical protein